MTSVYAKQEHTDFTGASRRALRQPELQTALARLAETLAAGNRAAWEAMPQSDALRELARQIKDEALGRLDDYLRQLAEAVQSTGGHVHWAQTAEQARQYVLEIARQHGVQRVVKSKSMTTEEIHLNPALERAGIEVVETDFGEFIAQSAGQRPSHLVAPVIHMTLAHVTAALSRALGQELPADPARLAAAARAALRRKFQSAHMGISGANFVVAETGTICIVSNEGNARLTTTVPPVHVAIVGIEKVIPRLQDLPVFLKLLARAAVGQKLSVYTSLITGPRRCGELDGPEHLHLILLDNGRSRLLSSPYREALYCIRCGACLNTCPVYRKVGGHAYGKVYCGPIGAVLTPLRDGLTDFPLLPHASSLCGACQEACPLKISIPHMLLGLRSDLCRDPAASKAEKAVFVLWKAVLRRPALYRLGTLLATRLLGRDRASWFARLPGPLAAWTQARDFPRPRRHTFRHYWNLHLQHPPQTEPDNAHRQQTHHPG